MFHYPDLNRPFFGDALKFVRHQLIMFVMLLFGL